MLYHAYRCNGCGAIVEATGMKDKIGTRWLCGTCQPLEPKDLLIDPDMLKKAVFAATVTAVLSGLLMWIVVDVINRFYP